MQALSSLPPALSGGDAGDRHGGGVAGGGGDGGDGCWESVAPGRLCLFGEHQDYLGLPVIAAALPLSCRIRVLPRNDRILRLTILHPPPPSSRREEGKPPPPAAVAPSTIAPPPSPTVRTFDLDCLPPPPGDSTRSKGGDGFLDVPLAALHEFRNHIGIETWNTRLRGADCTSSGDLPWQVGCSSSSAFSVAFVQVLVALCYGIEPDGIEGKERAASAMHWTPLQIAQLAHRAEVVHFGGPGGTMDHVTSALGGLLRIGATDCVSRDDDSNNDAVDPMMWSYEQFRHSRSLGVWVLAHSGEPKDTLRHLRRCKNARLDLFQRLGGTWEGRTGSDDDNGGNLDGTLLTDDDCELWRSTRINRDTEACAAALLRRHCDDSDADPVDETSESLAVRLGRLMGEHHAALRDGLGLSTPRLEAMGQAALQAGAHGFKLVGSGGGGCGVAWTDSDNSSHVAEAMVRAGATQTWIVAEPAQGAHIVRLARTVGR